MNRCTFGIPPCLSGSISSSFAVPFLSLSSEFAQHLALGSLARAAPNRDNHLTLEFIIASESVQRKKKQCPPMCSLFYPFAEFLHSLRIRVQTYVSGLGMLISTKRNCSGFQTVSMASRRPRRLHSRFIYDAMNLSSAKNGYSIRWIDGNFIELLYLNLYLHRKHVAAQMPSMASICFTFFLLQFRCHALVYAASPVRRVHTQTHTMWWR